MTNPIVPRPKIPDLPDYEILNRNNPKSIVSKAPEILQRSIEAVPEELLLMDSTELRAHISRSYDEEWNQLPKTKITVTDERIRTQFWAEYEASITLNLPISIPRIYAGISSKQYFYERVLKNPLRMAWMLCPPHHYQNAMEEALLYGIDQMRDILAIPHVSKTGLVDSKLCQVKVNIVQMLDQRVKGAVLQKTQTLQVNAKVEDLPEIQKANQNMSDIDRRLRELEEESRALLTQAGPAPSTTTIGGVQFNNGNVIIETTHREVRTKEGDETKAAPSDAPGEGDE